MARYIDADGIVYYIRYVSSNGLEHDVRKIAFSDEIGRMPTVDVIPRAIINQIFEELFFSERIFDGELAVSHDNILKIKNEFQRRLNL